MNRNLARRFLGSPGRVRHQSRVGHRSSLSVRVRPFAVPLLARANVDGFIDIGPLTGDLATQGRAVLEALSVGRITPNQAATIMQAISAQARIVEVDELERRIAALEAKRCRTD